MMPVNHVCVGKSYTVTPENPNHLVFSKNDDSK